jgi:hypothetical protein
MLDRTRIIKELTARSGAIGEAVRNEWGYAQDLWKRIADDVMLCSRLELVSGEMTPEIAPAMRSIVPSWHGPLNSTVAIEPWSVYEVLAVDGSQIYPDHNQTTLPCFLINIGVVNLRYSENDQNGGCSQESSVTFESLPYLVLEEEGAHPEIINAQRTEQELYVGLEWMHKRTDRDGAKVLLFDGPLVFWYLSSIHNGEGLSDRDATKAGLFTRYLALLEQFFEHGHTIAGYMSMPKSRELVHILRKAALLEGQICDFQYISDSTLAEMYLQPGTRSTLFRSHAPVTAYYPRHSAPHFFYMHTGYEIARIDVPAWVALNQERIAAVCRTIYDQALKGQGYPVALAEAHEQAVITGADRDFFYQLLRTIVPCVQQRPSQKSAKKRHMSI